MTRAALVLFLRRHRYAVEASVAAGGAPQAAVIGVAVTDQLELVFDTLGDTRKMQNLQQNSKVAPVIGWDDEQTVQYEGLADEPQGAELARLKAIYFAAWPECRPHEAWPGITYVRVRPRWIRYSDFHAASPAVQRWDVAELEN